MTSTDLALPWTLGQGTMQLWMDHAQSTGKTFSVYVSAATGFGYASIGGRPVGLINLATLSAVKWPTIDPSPIDLAEWLHAEADRSPSAGLCYFIGGSDGAVKIGHSVDVPGRLRAIAACSPIPLSVLAIRAGGERRETAYHEQFAAHRLHGEWFTRCPEIEAEIAHLNTIAQVTG